MSADSFKDIQAYSLLTIKSIDEEQRMVYGVATTPEPDRVGDIVEPFGVEFSNPMPFLFHHDATKPIGQVWFDPPTAHGITFKAHIPDVPEPGVVRDRVQEAWHSVKYKLIAGVSVGLRAMLRDVQALKTGGIHYLKSKVHELSLVTLPQNADAGIRIVKSLDQDSRRSHAAPGQRIVSVQPSGASDVTRKDTKSMQTYQEQITSYTESRRVKFERMQGLMSVSAEKGETLDDAAGQEYEGLEQDIAQIDKHLERLNKLAAMNAAAAVPVVAPTARAASIARSPSVVQVYDRLEPGIEFARYAMCLAAAKGNIPMAESIALKRYPDQVRVLNVLKAAVAAGTTTDADWAGNLVDYQNFAGDFIEYLRPMTIIGKFGTGNIPSLNRVPFNIRILGQATGADAYWVGEGKAKPVTKFDTSAVTLRWAKLANIAVITEELARFSTPSAERLVRDELARAIIARMDQDFIRPDKAAVANVSPASITNGITPITSSGTTAAAVRTDIQAIFQAFIDANMTPVNGVWIMSNTTALALSLMQNSLGQPEFNGITMLGGTFQGLPVIASQYVTDAGSPGGGLLILVNASDIFLSDDGQVVIDSSREASLEMADNPSGDATVPTATQLVSLWQQNCIGIKAERFINWQRRRDEAVQYLYGVNYIATGSPS